MRELPLRANTVTQHPKYKHRGRQKSRHLPRARGWLAKSPRVPHAESAAGAKKKKSKKQKTAHPSPTLPPNPCPAFKPPSSGWADRAHPGSRLPRLQPRKSNFQSIQRPRPPCKRSLPKNTVSPWEDHGSQRKLQTRYFIWLYDQKEKGK